MDSTGREQRITRLLVQGILWLIVVDSSRGAASDY